MAKDATPVTSRKAIYAGSFDPLTNGHLDVIRRACALFDEVIVAVGRNQSKPPLFSVDERLAILAELCAPFGRVRVEAFGELVAKFAQKQGVHTLVRGLRGEADFAYEVQMAAMNRLLDPALDTVFLPTNQALSHISSSLVKEVASYGGDISQLVPPLVLKKLAEKFPKRV